MLWIQDLQIPWNQWLLVSITVHTSLTIFLTQWPFERDTSLDRIKQQVRCNLLISVVVVHLSRESSCNPNTVEILVHLSCGVGILVHLSCGVGILVHPWRWGLVPKMDALSHQSRAIVGVCDLFANFALPAVEEFASMVLHLQYICDTFLKWGQGIDRETRQSLWYTRWHVQKICGQFYAKCYTLRALPLRYKKAILES